MVVGDDEAACINYKARPHGTDRTVLRLRRLASPLLLQELVEEILEGRVVGKVRHLQGGAARIRFGLDRNLDNRGKQALRQVGDRGKLFKLGLRRLGAGRSYDKTKAQHAKRHATQKVTHDLDSSRHVIASRKSSDKKRFYHPNHENPKAQGGQ